MRSINHKNRKGQAEEYFMKYILVLAGLALLSGLTIYFMINLDARSERELCQNSVRQNALLRFKGFGGEEIGSRITCPTQKLNLKINTQDAKESIAQELYWCKKNFLEGELELFDGEGTYCHPCAFIQFKEQEGTMSVTDFLATKKAPIPDQDKTYLQFLQGTQTGFQFILDENQQVIAEKYQETYQKLTQEQKQKVPASLDQELSASKNYGVLFWYAKGDTGIKALYRKLGLIKIVAGSGTAGGAAGLFGTAAVIGTSTFALPFVIIGGSIAAGTAGFLALDSAPGQLHTATASAVLLVEWNEATLRDAGCNMAAVYQNN